MAESKDRSRRQKRGGGRRVRRRRPPELVVRIPLEQPGRIRLEAETYADEMRLRRWLASCGALDDLAAELARLLDDLDELDRSAA